MRPRVPGEIIRVYNVAGTNTVNGRVSVTFLHLDPLNEAEVDRHAPCVPNQLDRSWLVNPLSCFSQHQPGPESLLPPPDVHIANTRYPRWYPSRVCETPGFNLLQFTPRLSARSGSRGYFKLNVQIRNHDEKIATHRRIWIDVFNFRLIAFNLWNNSENFKGINE